MKFEFLAKKSLCVVGTNKNLNLFDDFQAKSLVTNSIKLWLPVFQPKDINP